MCVKERRDGSEVGRLSKGNMKDPCGDSTVLYLDCVNVYILVVIVYSNFARLYHWGKTVKLRMRFLCTMSYNCM